MTTEEFLKLCTVEGLIVKFPDIQLKRDEYEKVKKRLEGLGGKWKGGKTKGFVFEYDPTELLKDAAEGIERNLAKETQFYPTPLELADKLALLLDGQVITTKTKILEPSAGKGALIVALTSRHKDAMVDYYEISQINKEHLLNAFAGQPHVCKGADFLECDKKDYYDIIIANPPFTKNQDIDHIKKMFEVCKEGTGVIVTIASNSWRTGSQKKQVEFRDWLTEIGATIEDIPAGAFQDSGTMVASCMIRINKPYRKPEEILTDLIGSNMKTTEALYELASIVDPEGMNKALEISTTAFFQRLGIAVPAGKFTFTFLNKGGQITLGYFLDDNKMQVMKGTAEELDRTFFEHLGSNLSIPDPIKKKGKVEDKEEEEGEDQTDSKAATPKPVAKPQKQAEPKKAAPKAAAPAKPEPKPQAKKEDKPVKMATKASAPKKEEKPKLTELSLF